jgi:formylglycine-generating enzyme required for sulfatase activity/predicted Ser/Thr protein kinase
MLLSTGQVLQNRYRVVKLLAQGGFGSVYRAWDTRLNMPVALKESLDTSPQATRQFTQEAKLLSNLIHPNLPRVLDFFSVPSQGLYLVMEFVQGEDLDEKLDTTNGPIVETKVLPWILQICDALIYLHSRTPPIIHRDIKPANIRITPEDRAFLVDFGIAKQYHPGSRTITGARAVTPGYAPFEQYSQKSTDTRSDIYALGATLYHLLTGQKPPESIDRVAGERLVPPRQLNPNLHPGIEAAILRAMQVLPEQRYHNVADFKHALENPVEPTWQVNTSAQKPQAAPVQPVSPPAVYVVPAVPKQVAQPPRRKWLWLGLAASVILLSTVVLASLVYMLGGQEDLTASQTIVAETQAALNLRSTLLPSSTHLTPTPSETPLPTLTASPTSVPTDTLTPFPSLTSIITPDISPTPLLPNDQIMDAQGTIMVLIRAGEFLMGNDTDAWQSRPKHSVNLDAYYIDLYEVSNAAYAQCVNANICKPPARTKSKTRTTYFGDAEYNTFPVVQVDWNMAQQYCEWRGARLPTEAEWEKAARGDADERSYPWGEDISCTLTNYANCKIGDTEATDSHPDGNSPYGISNMAGNVLEWVADRYFDEYYRNSPAANPQGPSFGEYRALRGGSFMQTSNFLRVYYRYYELPTTLSYWVGFRCARSVP